jgi:hypothetical protein
MLRPRLRSSRRVCVGCGVKLSSDSWWSYCWRCWQLKRAAARSWHWQLERVLAELKRLEELSVDGPL